jgi:type VI secretion system secreted protein VgrG
VKGAVNLAAAHALSYVGSKGTLGAVAAAALGIERAAYEGGDKGGWKGAKEAALGSAAGTVAGLIPGGDAIMAAVSGSGKRMPWEHDRPDEGAAAPGGGAAGAGGADGGPSGPGPGHRSVVASSSYTETIGALYSVATPGPVSWITAGASTTIINGSHSTRTASAGMKVTGGLGEVLGSLNITSGGLLVRKTRGAMSSTIGGALSINAGGAYSLSAHSVLTLKVGGSLTLGGAPITFKCGGSEITADPGGVLLKSSTITITGTSNQSSSRTHR